MFEPEDRRIPNTRPISRRAMIRRGIDVGFLIKTSKIKVTRFGTTRRGIPLKHKDAKPNEMLFGRPPFLIEAEAKKNDGSKFSFTVIVNHFKSYLGIDDPLSGDRVRNQKRLQAEFLADAVIKRKPRIRMNEYSSSGTLIHFSSTMVTMI